MQDIKNQAVLSLRDPFGATSFLRFNVKRKPFDDVRVRQALALGLDKEEIVTNITRCQQARPMADTLVPPATTRGYTPPPGLGSYTVAKRARPAGRRPVIPAARVSPR